MKLHKAIIVDDESKARENLFRLLERHCPELEVVAMCENVVEAKVALIERSPDLMFLDIKMPSGSGIEMVQSIERMPCKVIFVTAHADHAVDAFTLNASDYILKPIHSKRLIQAVQKALGKNTDIDEMPAKPASGKPRSRVSFPTLEGFELVDPDSIIRIQAKGTRSIAHLMSGDELDLSKNLKVIEELLEGGDFLRIHHGHLVNINKVKKYVHIDGGFVIMDDGREVEVSRRKKKELLDRLKTPS